MKEKSNAEIVCFEEFLSMINQRLGISRESLIQHGIISQKEAKSSEENVSRRACAKILYEIMHEYMSEPDEQDWSAALDLRDIYECRACVKYIAQIYAKGVMAAYEDRMFSQENLLTKEVAMDSVSKVADRALRMPPKRIPVMYRKCSPNELEKAVAVKRQAAGSCEIIDVRSHVEYTNNSMISESINIPLEKIIQNPYVVSQNINVPVYLICDKGYKSSLAAHLLVKQGFREVYYISNQEIIASK